MDIMFVTDTKTTVVYQTYRQTLIMYTVLLWSTVKTNDCSLYLVTLTYVFSEGKVCIADQDLSLVVSLKGVYTFFGGWRQVSWDQSNFSLLVLSQLYETFRSTFVSNAYAMEVSLIEKNMLMIIEYVICIGKT